MHHTPISNTSLLCSRSLLLSSMLFGSPWDKKTTLSWPWTLRSTSPLKGTYKGWSRHVCVCELQDCCSGKLRPRLNPWPSSGLGLVLRSPLSTGALAVPQEGMSHRLLRADDCWGISFWTDRGESWLFLCRISVSGSDETRSYGS